MTEELKPCPFCGGEARIDVDIDDRHENLDVMVYCEECGCQTPDGYESIEEAVSTWNTRVDKCSGCGLALSHNYFDTQPEGEITTTDDIVAWAAKMD